MKQLFLLFASFLLLTLAACSEDNTEKESKNNTSEKQHATAETSSDHEEKEPAKQQAIVEDDQPVKEKDENTTSDFAEYPMIQKEITDFEQLQPVVETDNPNKRVILYQADNGQKKYKSIFIKQTKRLKIIELNKNGLLYNQIISE